MRILFCFILTFAACTPPRVELGPNAAGAIEQASLQNEAIASTLHQPFQAAGIKNNSEVTRHILSLGSNKSMRPTVAQWEATYPQRLQALQEEWSDEKTAYETQIQKNEKAFTAAKEEAKSKSFWLKIVGAAGVLWGALRTFRGPISALGVAMGAPWLSTAVNIISGVGNLPKRIDNLKTLVAGSDVGLRELQDIEKQLDVELSGKLSALVKKYTTKDSLADIVRDFAKATAQEKHAHAGVREELARVRDEEDITGIYNVLRKRIL